MSLTVEVAAKTDVGCVRTNNEDSFGYDLRHGIFVVCDGMGGQAAGEVASKIGVEVLLNYFQKAATAGESQQPSVAPDGISPDARALASAVQMANRTIFDLGQKQAGNAGMGSTIVAALLKDNAIAIANVGDSRIYLIRQGTIQQLTQDHSLVMEQVRRGYITLEQAQHSDMQNIILKALGSEAEVAPDVENLVVVAGDILLMCSDGLTKYVRDEEILKVTIASSLVEEACDALIQAAKERGGDDNITCLLFRIVERPWYKNLLRKWLSAAPVHERSTSAGTEVTKPSAKFALSGWSAGGRRWQNSF